MADEAARRDFRRKRILENAENRLLKLTDVESRKQKDTYKGSADKLFNVAAEESGQTVNKLPLTDADQLCDGSSSTCYTNRPTFDSEVIRKIGVAVSSKIHDHLDSNSSTLPLDNFSESVTRSPDRCVVDDHVRLHTTRHPQLVDILFEWRKVIVALLAVIIRFAIYLFSDEITVLKYSLMSISTFEIGLFVARAMTEVDRVRPPQGYLLAVLLLLGFKNSQRIVHTFNVVTAILEDYAVFLFTFSLCHRVIDDFESPSS